MNKIQFLKTLLLYPIIDLFDRANSTNSLGSTDTGQVWTNSVMFGNALGISSNAAYSAGAVDAAAVVETYMTNGDVTFVLGTYSDYVGFAFRYTDNNNYCECAVLNSIHKFWVQGKSSGSSFGGSSTSGYYISSIPTIANGDTLKIRMSGTTITFYVNGSSIGSLTISQNATATKHGIRINSTVARINSFRFDLI